MSKDACLMMSGEDAGPGYEPATGMFGPFLVACYLTAEDGLIKKVDPVQERVDIYRVYAVLAKPAQEPAPIVPPGAAWAADLAAVTDGAGQPPPETSVVSTGSDPVADVSANVAANVAADVAANG
jgi:hypothetical protein